MFRRGLAKGKLQVGSGDRRTNEPEYEEVGPPTHLRKTQESRGNGQGSSSCCCCDLCGSAAAAVRCDHCGSQAFCLSCDDMYHRHPRRSTHVRKAVDSKSTTGGGVRPPLPPKEVQVVGVAPPQPPPRKNKRSGFLSSTAFSRKDQKYARPGIVTPRSTSMTNLQNAASEVGGSAGRTIMGSLKRFMGARPLPPTPDQHKAPVKNDTVMAPQSKPVNLTTSSPSLPNLNDHIDEDIRVGLPQSVLDLNKTVGATPNATSASSPATPASAHAQYPPLQPKAQQPAPNTHSLGRKFSLQALPQSLEDKRTSMVEPAAGGVPWEGEAAKPPPRTRSQSISDDQWAQVMAAQTGGTSAAAPAGAPAGPACPPGHTPADMSAFAGATTRRGYNTLSSSGRGGGGALGRGMVSSASVCDLNTLSQQQPQPAALNGAHAASSFQQLNMMGYGGGMVWGAPCDLCQVMPMYPGHPSASGMKRAASNLSMNLSSLGSDVSGYPWAPPPPHIHHHMPMYPGYYPGYHPHMAPPPMGSAMGLNMSIPDSMHTFSKVPSSPAPSVRSSSHRSHKSAKSRSFSAADAGGRRSRTRRMKRSEGSEESRSSSASDVDDDDDGNDDRESKAGQGGGSSLAWQCDHCTFINSGGTRTCGMCSKTVGGGGGGGRSGRRGSERRRSERRRDRRTDPEENDRDASDYDNDGGGVVRSNLSFNIRDSKREARAKATGASKGKSKKKSRRRGSSASGSDSKSEGEEEEEEEEQQQQQQRRLERHMRDLRVSSSSSRRRGSDHDGVNGKDKDRDRDRGSRKREGNVGRFKNRGKSHSERARTPGRQTPRRTSPVDGDEGSFDGSSDSSPEEGARSSQHNTYSGDRDGHHCSLDGTLVETLASEATVRAGRKSKSDSSEGRSKPKSSKASSQSSGEADEEHVLEHSPQVPVANKKYGSARDRSPSPKLEVRKSKSPELSQRTSRGEGDDPSFANTLDDITTMGTNEVADQDLSSNYIEDRPRSTDLPVEPQEDVPVVKYIRPITPEEEVADEPKTIAVEPTPIRQVEPQKIEVKDEPEVVAVQDTGQIEDKSSPEQLYEPSYEIVEQPPEMEAPVMVEAKPTNNNARDTNHQEQGDHRAAVTGAPLEELRAETEQEEVNAENVQEVKMKQASPIDIRREVARSTSPGSSLGFNSSPPDRQYTPLSFSSSDAQFYSPPDSPDISLSEQLQDRPQIGQTQAERQNKTMKWGLEDVNEKFLTVEEIITKRRQEAMRKQGLQLVQVLRDAEDLGYASEDVSIALTHCGDKNPLEWLKENWRHMVDTVSTLATNYGQERRVNDVGSITAAEARTSLRVHKGNIWAAVTECVEQRQKKFNEIYSRGRFKREEVVRALETHDGDADAAFLELNKSQLQPFMMKIWNPLLGQEKPAPKAVSLTPVPVEVQGPAPPSVQQNVGPAPAKLDVPRPAREDVPQPLTQTDAARDAKQTQPAEFEEEEETDDDDDVFENTYANIDPVKEEPPKEEPIYATVQKKSKEKNKENDPQKFTILAKKDERPQDRRPLTPNRIDLTPTDEDELFSASEVAEPESEEESTIEELLGEIGSTPYYEYFSAVDLEEFEDSDEDESDIEVEEPQASRGVASASPTAPSDQMDALSDSASGESQEEKQEEARETHQETQTLQYVRKEESEEEPEEPREPETPHEPEEPRGPEEPEGREEPQARPAAWPLDEPGMAQTRTGPVTLQKATVIVGKAIAKAMARETSVRESSSRSVTPEVQEATPEPSEDEEITVQVTASDSDSDDDDDHLRPLDTIIEEGASSRAEASESSVAGSSPAPPSPGAPSPAQTPSPVVPTPSPVPPTPSPIPPPPEATPTAAAAAVQEDATEEAVATVTIKTVRKRPTTFPDTAASTSQPRCDETHEKTEPAERGSIRRGRSNAREEASPNTQATSPSTPTPSTSSTSKVPSARRTRKTSLPESSGESEDEDRVEGLKARHDRKNPDYQEVRELKEQIQMMRRQLEARIEDADDRPETPEAPKEALPSGEDPDIAQQEETPERPASNEYEQLLFDRKVRRLLAEGRAGSYEKAELAAHLLTFNFDETDSLQAAEECSSIYTALQFLQQECELCAEKYPMRKMMSMLQCTHRCCCECAKTYFTFQIKTKNIREVRCPFCNEPDLDANEEIANEYLNNMDILLKNILDEETHELFQRKLRDWTLMKDPNFRWCNKCSSGFIANPRARKLICPDCKDVTCAHCRASWEATHEGISCEAFARWKTENDAEIAAQGVAKHLAECGITCPKCKFTYALAKGGCMHFTCTQCKYEFCSGCSHPFRQGSKCPVGPYCERLGLHAHHPRNCLFYLRDKEPQQLQNLLKEAGVSYDTEPQGGQEKKIGLRPVCQVQEQKELPDGLKDDICGRVVPSGYAGLCRLHYTEYLVEKINAHKLDPVSIFDEADLRVCLRRNGKTVPIRRWESEKLYRDKLIKLIKEHLPLSNLD